jgi:cyclase
METMKLPFLSRRSFVSGAVRSSVGVSLGLAGLSAIRARAQSVDGAVDLGDGFHVFGAGNTNVLAIAAGDGVALVDGGAPGESAALLARVAELTGGGAVHTLFNTHWHPEHTGSNEMLGNMGARIVSHVNTRLWLTTDVTWPWNEQTVEPLPESAWPNETFYDRAELMVGDKRVVCGHLRDCPHTDGDMYVYFPDANVMAIGDAVSGAGWPSIDWWTGGWIGGIVGSLDMILTVSNDDTRYVVGRGPVLTRADMLDQFEMYIVVWQRMQRILNGGGGPKEAIEAQPTKEFNDIMGPSDEFVVRAFESMGPYLSPDA